MLGLFAVLNIGLFLVKHFCLTSIWHHISWKCIWTIHFFFTLLDSVHLVTLNCHNIALKFSEYSFLYKIVGIFPHFYILSWSQAQFLFCFWYFFQPKPLFHEERLTIPRIWIKAMVKTIGSVMEAEILEPSPAVICGSTEKRNRVISSGTFSIGDHATSLTFARKVHGLLLDGVVRARNCQFTLENCLRLEELLFENFADRNVEQAFSLNCHCRRLTSLIPPAKEMLVSYFHTSNNMDSLQKSEAQGNNNREEKRKLKTSSPLYFPRGREAVWGYRWNVNA